jgi:hypothetical protein
MDRKELRAEFGLDVHDTKLDVELDGCLLNAVMVPHVLLAGSSVKRELQDVPWAAFLGCSPFSSLAEREPPLALIRLSWHLLH